jgi:hypothetical protein
MDTADAHTEQTALWRQIEATDHEIGLRLDDRV